MKYIDADALRKSGLSKPKGWTAPREMMFQRWLAAGQPGIVASYGDFPESELRFMIDDLMRSTGGWEELGL